MECYERYRRAQKRDRPPTAQRSDWPSRRSLQRLVLADCALVSWPLRKHAGALGAAGELEPLVLKVRPRSAADCLRTFYAFRLRELFQTAT